MLSDKGVGIKTPYEFSTVENVNGLSEVCHNKESEINGKVFSRQHNDRP